MAHEQPVLAEATPWLAASDEERLFDLVNALAKPGIDAIIEARGGYGCTRILDRIPRGLLASRPRWLVGYSDITALHLLAARERVASIHGPMVAGFAKHGDDGSIAELFDLLATPKAPRVWEGLTPVCDGQAEGIATGGNLSLLAALIGTEYLPDWNGRVAFIEEIAEAPYRIDRMLTTIFSQSRAAGLRGVVLGQFTNCGEADAGERCAIERVRELVGALGIPVLCHAPFGHGTPNRPFVHGVPVCLDAASGSIRWPGAESLLARPIHVSPRSAKSLDSDTSEVARLAAEALRNNVCSALQLDVRIAGKRVLSHAAGFTRGDRGQRSVPVTDDTRFDIASITKVFSTATLAWLAIERRFVALDDTLPLDLGRGAPTLRDLLRHHGGYRAHVEVFREARIATNPRNAALAAFAAVNRDQQTPVYSDVGYIALGRWLERLFGEDLATLFSNHIAGPLSLPHSGFGDGATPLPHAERIAATEFCPWRRVALQGVVHDENCQVLGGVAGHAGLFSTASELGVFAQSLLGHGHPLLKPSTVAAMWSRDQIPHGGTYTLGWDTPSGALSSAGTQMPREATVGHLGFTGTSLWIDRSRALSVVLLTNRVHVSRASDLIRALRPAMHDAVVREVFADESARLSP